MKTHLSFPNGPTIESRMRQRIVKILKPLHAVSVENSCGSGTPDINFTGGWLECKCINTWPKWYADVVKVPHFTPQQRLWLTQRTNAGGYAEVVLKVGRSWALLPGKEAAEHLGIDWTKHEIITQAVWWKAGLNEQEFLAEIKWWSEL
jgi:hypothetical protein